MGAKLVRFSYALGIRDKREWQLVKTYKNMVFEGTEPEASKKLQEVFEETGELYEIFLLLEVSALEKLFGAKKKK